jgi:hypothetical protein
MEMSEDEFFDMEPAMFASKAKGWGELQRMRQRDTYDSARMVARIVAQVHAKKGVTVKPTQIAEFPWDNNKTNRTKEGYITYEQGSAMLSLVSTAKT